MKKFILKSFIFLLPVTLAYCITDFFYSTKKGDLLRIGYIADLSNYDREAIFSEEFERKIHYTKISEIDLKQKHNFKILNIGDSFSQQNNFGYTNYLAEYLENSILDYDRKLGENQSPIETLTCILNGDVLDSIKVDYILLQTVERNFVRSAINLNRKGKVTLDSLNILIQSKRINSQEINTDKLFSGRMKKFITTNYYYQYDDHPFNSQTYKVETTKNLFSINKNELLFYQDDIDFLNTNNDLKKINKLNAELNILSKKLAKKNIKLIVMPAPDKYGIYYEYITNKSKYPEPLFFDLFEKLQNKDYLYIDAKTLLKKHIPNKKDIYFYDDTHWSPWASQIIAKEIEKKIIEN